MSGGAKASSRRQASSDEPCAPRKGVAKPAASKDIEMETRRGSGAGSTSSADLLLPAITIRSNSAQPITNGRGSDVLSPSETPTVLVTSTRLETIDSNRSSCERSNGQHDCATGECNDDQVTLSARTGQNVIVTLRNEGLTSESCTDSESRCVNVAPVAEQANNNIMQSAAAVPSATNGHVTQSVEDSTSIDIAHTDGSDDHAVVDDDVLMKSQENGIQHTKIAEETNGDIKSAESKVRTGPSTRHQRFRKEQQL